LGAEFYIESEDPGTALLKLGGASAIIATAASGSAMSPLIPGLATRGVLVVVGGAFDDPITVHTGDMFFGSRRIIGSMTGSSIENEDSIAFSRRNGVQSMNEVWPFTDAPGAYDHMISGKARFRVVLDMAA
jgi:D-arabinose 1-dehydrogenase-like Zn-dependent alcohol dehydrogenase